MEALPAVSVSTRCSDRLPEKTETERTVEIFSLHRFRVDVTIFLQGEKLLLALVKKILHIFSVDPIKKI